MRFFILVDSFGNERGEKKLLEYSYVECHKSEWEYDDIKVNQVSEKRVNE